MADMECCHEHSITAAVAENVQTTRPKLTKRHYMSCKLWVIVIYPHISVHTGKQWGHGKEKYWNVLFLWPKPQKRTTKVSARWTDGLWLAEWITFSLFFNRAQPKIKNFSWQAFTVQLMYDQVSWQCRVIQFTQQNVCTHTHTLRDWVCMCYVCTQYACYTPLCILWRRQIMSLYN